MDPQGGLKLDLPPHPSSPHSSWIQWLKCFLHPEAGSLIYLMTFSLPLILMNPDILAVHI